MDANLVRDQFGEMLGELSLALFEIASEIALDRGIILADTKLEFGYDPILAQNTPTDKLLLILGDERFTPDSSRFWLLKDWKSSRANGTSPISFDKQYVREWGKLHGVHTRNPLVPKDVEHVHGLVVPQSVLLATRQLYRYIFYLLTGKRLETFQQDDMGISVSPLPVEVVVGSTSDLEQIEKGLDELRVKKIPFRVHVISCHRNPDELRKYARYIIRNDATVIAAAGKAAALPGVLSAWLRFYGKAHIPVIGVALKGKNYAENEAAALSIEQLPGNPVILGDDKRAFFGSDGFHAACVSAATKDFFVPSSTSKEAQFDIMRAQPATVQN
jgi:phosphoribosylaminoimidazole carboxylase PurE protein